MLERDVGEFNKGVVVVFMAEGLLNGMSSG